MIRFIIALVIVVGVVLGGLLALRRSKLAQPSQEVLDRVKIRERKIEAQERAQGEE
jgi:Protein of unknown function (DUF2897)